MLSSYGKYNVFLPLVVHFWKRIGFRSIITIVYYSKDNSIPFILRKLKQEGAYIRLKYIKNKSNIDYYSRIERIFSFYNVYDKHGIYATSDADMIPINKYFYYDIKSNLFNIKSYGTNGYGIREANRRWPMCYFISTINIWRNILQLNDSISKKNIDNYEDGIVFYLLNRNRSYYAGSYHRIDEVYMRDKIRNSLNFPKNVAFYKRNFHKTRIGDTTWNRITGDVNWTNIYDIHISSHEKNLSRIWMKMRNFLAYFNVKEYGIEYVNEFISLYGKG